MFSSVTQKVNTKLIFNKALRVKHLDWSSKNKEAHLYDYLRDHTARDICDRIDDLTGEDSRVICNIGACSGLITKYLNPSKVTSLIHVDVSPGYLRRCMESDAAIAAKYPIEYLECDEEELPLKSDFADLAISCLNMHWVNDLPKSFKRVNTILKDNSPFIGCILGGDTLYELRSSLQLAELERLGKFDLHIAPKTTGQDMGLIMQSSGFKLITVDISQIQICYPSMFELMFDLQGMGENNASIEGSKHLNRDVLLASAAIYQSLYGRSEADGGGVPATFQMIHFIGWKNPTKATPLRNQ